MNKEDLEQLTEILKAVKTPENHFNAPIINYGSISGTVINPTYNDCGKLRKEDMAEVEELKEWKKWEVMQSDKAKELWRLLVSHGYCCVHDSMLSWKASQAEYGYMVYIVSDILHLRHPSSGRLQWKPFLTVFDNGSEMESVAKVQVCSNITSMGNSRAWCNEAKNLRNILMK